MTWVTPENDQQTQFSDLFLHKRKYHFRSSKWSGFWYEHTSTTDKGSVIRVKAEVFHKKSYMTFSKLRVKPFSPKILVPQRKVEMYKLSQLFCLKPTFLEYGMNWGSQEQWLCYLNKGYCVLNKGSIVSQTKDLLFYFIDRFFWGNFSSNWRNLALFHQNIVVN